MRIMKEVRVQASRPKRAASLALPMRWLQRVWLLAVGLGLVVEQQHATIADLSRPPCRVRARRRPGCARSALRRGARLPALPAGKVYQMWTLAKGRENGDAVGDVYAPDSAAAPLVAIPANAANTAATAISVEPAGGSQQPTTKPIAVIKLGA